MKHFSLALICSWLLFCAALGGGEKPFVVFGIFLLGPLVFISRVLISTRCSPLNSLWYFAWINLWVLAWANDKTAQLCFFIASFVFTFVAAVSIKLRNASLEREAKTETRPHAFNPTKNTNTHS